MKSLIVAWKDVKIRIIDRRGVMMMLLMPLLLTAILGSALSNIFDNGGLPKTVIGYYQEGPDEFGEMLRKDILQSKEIEKDIKVEMVTSQSELEELLKKQKIDVGVIIPSGWSEQIEEGTLKEAKLMTNPAKDIQAKIAESIIRSFTEQAQTIAVSTQVVITELAKWQPKNIEQIAKEVSTNLQTVATSDRDEVEKGTIGKKTVTAMQYYAAAMVVMFLLFNITVGAKSIITERRTETLARLFSTPTSSFSILLGKFFGTLLFSLIQFGVFVLATHYVFHVNWGENIFQMITVGTSYAICVSGLSMLIAAWIHEEKTADLMGGIGVQLLALLGGSMLPLYAFPDSLQTIAHIAPNKWALTSFLNIMSGTSWSTLLPVILSLASAGFVSVIIGTVRLRMR
ncbi:ABC transporter permease [Bacillus cytotoxicus]|uniref:ABC-2 type transporter n=1 Tax=Bacillus cytotoxicus TaxID=580165 RepID=A0AAX2CBU7_9BACI|nr:MULTISPECIES: ABC transporter permease [Bacillus cereus group]AWC27217.1 ABC transporter permease [Bacillus cytotoxicus]AWC31255.1 ABC transporter permease [Bacillus cytotoxicus]AWC35295.1 ABC transporter permease [Bacillus cytotoxicus]AWC39330.1 ABC transporter permease [Bacillus cytotoxicus]AWC47261.1 ABC transporter permease [Bacillus cytotoxicus]